MELGEYGRRNDQEVTGRGKKVRPNPTDRGKARAKCSLRTYGQGVPLVLTVAGANGHNMKLVRATLESLVVERPVPTPEAPHNLCLDKRYNFQELRDILAEFGFTAQIRARSEEAKELKR